MDVIFGDAPVAVALARRLGSRGPVVLGSSRPAAGPYLWRHVDLATGRGARQAAEGARRVFVAVEDDARTEGLFLVLRRARGLRGAVAVPLGVAPPRGLQDCPGLAQVTHGPAWGPEEPLVAAWTERITEGRRVLVADPGPLRPVPMDDLTAALEEAASRGEARWTLPGDTPARLPELVEALGRRLGRPARTWRVPLRWAARSAGVPPERILRWTRTPEAPRALDDWRPPPAEGGARGGSTVA